MDACGGALETGAIRLRAKRIVGAHAGGGWHGQEAVHFVTGRVRLSI